MDAQNAAGSDKPKPVAAAEKRQGNHQPDESKESTNNNKPPKSADESIKSPPNLPKDIKPSVTVARAPLAADEVPTERDSDAETIVLPGKDGHSPSKARKVKHEDRSDGELPPPRKNRDASASRDGDKDKTLNPPRLLSEGPSSLGAKKKRLHDQSSRNKDGSSGLSSAPASPPRRRNGGHSDSDTGADRRKSPKLPLKDRAKSTDRTVPHKRKLPKADSDDEGENRKARRQRISDMGVDSRPNRLPKEHKSAARRENEGHSGSRTRSVSPHHPRAHRRSISTQLPANSSNGLSHKKKRLPPPLQSTDYHSDESSASGSPHPRSSKLRNLSTPATAESNMSPAKIAPHKKHLDAHGQTFLARACARGEYDVAKQRLGERPEDLNVADYAGNTPLQIAAINGYEDIVKLLIDAGCNLDCVNYDKDTPLLDAVDNGHLGVVKLLLDAGVNPRKANVSGEEPLDRISDDLENAAEFRAALIEAKSRQGERRRTSEDHHSVDHPDGRSSHGPDSPRRSPAPSSSHASGRRAGSGRATKTSNHLLYMSLDDKTLRQAAARGDEETVTRILLVKNGCDDSEAMVAAARGGHEVVIQLLLALGNANPDPAPVPSIPPEFATPMLAAIGQENIKVVRLLLDQTNFDPTRRFKGETYYEIARRRQGTNWKDEEHMLQEAYDAYRKSHRDISKTKSPNRRERERERERERDRERDREQEREAKRQSRHELRDENRAHKRNLSSPSRDPEARKKPSASRNITSPKEKRRSDSFHDDQTSPKRGPGRPKKEDRVPTIAVSDREASPVPSQKQSAKAMKRAESDVAAISSEGEAVKPRRKLISKGELRGEREKNRRASMASTTSSLKDPSSPRDPKHDDHPEKPKGEPLSEKYHDRTKALKRDESRDRLSVSGDHSSKRHRSSVTPPHSSNGEKDDAEAPPKRRRLDVDGKERRPKSTASPDDPHRLSRDGPPRSKSNLRDHDDSDRRPLKVKLDSDSHRRESGKSSNSDKSSIHVKSEDVDIEMPDASDAKDAEESEVRIKKERDDEKRRLEEKERRKEEKRQEEKKRREAEAEEARRKEEERRQREADEKRREAEQKKREAEQKEREAEEKRLKEEEEAKQREEQERKRKELERKRQEEEERQRREAEEKKRREEEEKRLREEEEKKRREEEERKRKEEEARKQREMEERLRKEQLEREAAEARRLREEEERQERERKERLQREELERKRAAKEAEQRRIQEEQERLRLAKLPPLLRWLDGCPNPKTPELAAKFKHMQGVRYDTIQPKATGTPDGREQWVLNTHAALLLGEKDLTLSRYTAWEHVPVSDLAKKVIWRLESDRYALTTENLFELGTGLPDYYGEGQDPFKMNFRVREQLRGEAREKFLKMDMFFVKVSDLMYIIPNIPHLRSLRLSVEYRELPEDEGQLYGWKVSQKWKQDPDADRFYGFAPRNKYYVNGIMVEEQKPGLCATSSTPFPEKRVPRKGLQQIFPGDPDYARLCKEQGLDHLLNGTKAPPLPNGGHLSPRSQSNVTEASAEPVNGTHVASAPTPVPAPASVEAQPLSNGVNGVSASESS